MLRAAVCPLALRDNPMLDADFFAAVRIRPSRKIAGCENTWHARLKMPVDGNPILSRKPGVLRKRNSGPDPDADDHEVRWELLASSEGDVLVIYRSCCGAK